MKQITSEDLNFIDELLDGLEDHVHGKEGRDITKARKIIQSVFNNRINLKKIEQNIDEALEKETPESMTKWLTDKRNAEKECVMTLEECKDVVAKKYNYKDWKDMLLNQDYTLSNRAKYINEAIALYNNQ